MVFAFVLLLKLYSNIIGKCHDLDSVSYCKVRGSHLDF